MKFSTPAPYLTQINLFKVWVAILCFWVVSGLAFAEQNVSEKDNDLNTPHNLRSYNRQLISLKKFVDPATIVHKGGMIEETCTYMNNLGIEVSANPSVEPATYSAQVASDEIVQLLHLDTNTKGPIWTSSVISVLDDIVLSGGSISCPHYPHSAEDVALAVKKTGLNMKASKIGVVGSISPWVEHVLRSCGARHVITIDYNQPIICSGIDWIESKSIAEYSSEVGTYNLLVSFSAVEHSGLGRYGDPINPDADIEAVEVMYQALAPGGFLLLAIPTSAYKTMVEGGNAHRLYGQDRISQMLEGRFDFVGRVWDGHSLGGWDDIEKKPRLFATFEETDPIHLWKHQQVLVLRKQQK